MRKRFTQEFKQDAVSQVIGIWRRWTVVGLMPVCFAIARTLQCVASRGVLSNLWATTRSTSSSLILHGAPGRGSPKNPLRPRSMERWRHFPTHCLDTPSFSATSIFSTPDAQSRTMRARVARACAVLRRSIHASRHFRSLGETISRAFGRPIAMLSLLNSRDNTHDI